MSLLPMAAVLTFVAIGPGVHFQPDRGNLWIVSCAKPRPTMFCESMELIAAGL
jgi:hypothetical protein